MTKKIMLWLALRRENPRGKQLLLRLWDRAFGPVSVMTATGVSLRILLSSTQDLAFLRRPRNDRLARAISELPSGGVFVDIGANIGYYTILARKLIGSDGICVACEPSRREYVRLTENVQRNLCQDVITVHAALGEGKTVAFLEAERHHTGLNRVRFEPGAAVDESHLESCLVYPCDDLLNAVCPGRQVDLLKIDVEGAELLVLRGASQALASGKFKRVFVEITDNFLQRHGHTSDQLYRFMKQFRYSPTVGLLSEFQYDEIFERIDDAEVAYVGKG